MGVEAVQQQEQIRVSGARVGSVGGRIETIVLDWPSDWFGEDGAIEYNPITNGSVFDRRLAKIAGIEDVNRGTGEVIESLQPAGAKVLENAKAYLTKRVPLQVLERLQIIKSLGGDWEHTGRLLIDEIERLDV